MDCRSAKLAVLLAVAIPASGARAQFQPLVMKRPVTQYADLVLGRWSAPASGVDVMALNAESAPSGGLWWAHGDLLTDQLSTYLGPASVFSMATGWFDASSAGAEPDVLWGTGTSVAVSWGSEKTVAPDLFPGLTADGVWGSGAIRLLPREQALPILVSGGTQFALDALTAVDLAAVHTSPGTPPTRGWSMVSAAGTHSTPENDDRITRVYPVALSPAARTPGSGVEDAVVALTKGFYLLWHDAVPPAGTTLAGLTTVRSVEFGVAGSQDLTPFLPPGAVPNLSVLGVGPADVDGDGLPDLVFSYGSYIGSDPGRLMWIQNTGDVDAMALTPWRGLTADPAHPEFGVIGDAGILRSLDLGQAGRALAVFDRSADAIFVVTGSGASGFQVERLPIPAGARVRDMVAADVVGSPAKDLVVTADLPPFFSTREIWVYPDEGDLAPSLEWSPAPPAEALLGADLPLSVAASDPDTGFSLSWMRAPFAPSLGPSSIVLLGSSICDPSATLDVTVRALDSLGVYVERVASIPVVARPSLTLIGALPPGRVVLAPGGTSGRAEGAAWPACTVGPPAYTWGQLGLAGLVETSVQPAGSLTAWREFTIPESAYPEALAGSPELTLGASGTTTTGSASGTANLPLQLDARGLVAATVEFERVALPPGELGAARITLASRIGVPLPRVRAEVRLSGLASAGPLEATGAPAALGPGDGTVVVDPLPASPAVVEILVPVRSLGAPGGISVELFSEGGHRVSPEASPGADAARLPGCGCGDRGAGPLGLLLLIALAARGRRRPT